MDIVDIIRKMFKDDNYSFNTFVLLKSNRKVKKLLLDENTPNKSNTGFKEKIRARIHDYIRSNYLADEAEYTSYENIADNQHKFYVINQDGEYHPFDMLKEDDENITGFDISEINDLMGVLFKFEKENDVVWGYQHIYSIAIPNKSRLGFLLKQDGTIFKEMKEPLFSISSKINFMIVNGSIITNDIDIMQRNFGFSKFIRSEAAKVMSIVNDIGIVDSMDKIQQYVEGDKLTYAKKMMQIKSSPVLNMKPTVLLNKIKTSPTYSNKLKIVDNKIVLETKKQVEVFIKMLNDTWLKSELTEQLYEAEVKKKSE